MSWRPRHATQATACRQRPMPHATSPARGLPAPTAPPRILIARLSLWLLTGHPHSTCFRGRVLTLP